MSPLLTNLMWFAILTISLIVLLKSADYFVAIAELLGEKIQIPPFIIGATIVAFGTSLPELAVGVISVLQDESDIVTGTVIGSNISNILFILGVGITLSSGFIMEFKKLKIEFLILAIATCLAAVFLHDKIFTLFEALVFIVILALYLVFIIKYSKKEKEKNQEKSSVNISKIQYFLFGLSVLGVWIGAKYTTDAITIISQNLKLGNNIISQTVVALGTSLPELAVTISAVKSRQFEMILGNVIGSNIFNLIVVISVPAIIGVITQHPYLVQEEVFNQYSIPLLLISTVLLITISLFKSTPRIIGVVFLIFYVFFLIGSFLKINILASL